MDVLWDALVEAFRLLLSGDAETWEIIGRSLRISLSAASAAGGSRWRSSTPAWAFRRWSPAWS